MQPYTLPAFSGPLDLLVILVQREEIDVFDFSIQELIRQFKGKPEKAVLDDEITSICDLSSLIQIKTEKLLPPETHEAAEPEEEPHADFLRHLIQYASFKNLAHELSKKEDMETSFYVRGSEEPVIAQTPQKAMVSLQDFAQAFERILKEAERKKFHIRKEIWTVEGKIKYIREMVKHQSISFCELFSLEKPKEELIVTFLAVLELLKQEKIILTPDAQSTFVISKTMLQSIT